MVFGSRALDVFDAFEEGDAGCVGVGFVQVGHVGVGAEGEGIYSIGNSVRGVGEYLGIGNIRSRLR